eukprot:COSAG02_NODE_5582_length_4214_cov_17.001215_1_plen_181_part_00
MAAVATVEATLVAVDAPAAVTGQVVADDGADVVGHVVEAEPPTNSGPTRSRQCSICLLDVLHEQRSSTAHPASGCLHTFHWDCLATALAVDTSCPNCRRPYHVHGVYEVSPTGERRLHKPQYRTREQVPVDTSQYTMIQRCCMHRLAIPVIGMVSLLIAVPISTTLLILMVPDNNSTVLG